MSAGILVAMSEHRVGPFWRSEEVLAAIDAFAERAGRREAGWVTRGILGASDAFSPTRPGKAHR